MVLNVPQPRFPFFLPWEGLLWLSFRLEEGRKTGLLGKAERGPFLPPCSFPRRPNQADVQGQGRGDGLASCSSSVCLLPRFLRPFSADASLTKKKRARWGRGLLDRGMVALLESRFSCLLSSFLSVLKARLFFLLLFHFFRSSRRVRERRKNHGAREGGLKDGKKGEPLYVPESKHTFRPRRERDGI